MRRSAWIAGGAAGLLAAGAVLAVISLEDNAAPEREGGEGANSPAAGLDGHSSMITWAGRVVVDSGGGYVGPWRMNRSVWRYVDDPTVDLDAAGRASVAWVDQRRKDVLFQRYGSEGEPLLEEPVNVSRSPEVFSWLPRIVAAPGGERIYLLWQEIVFSGGTHGGEAFFARSTDGGRTFEEPINLSKTRAGAGKGRMSPDRWHNGSLDLARGPDGDLYAGWTVYEGGLYVARSTDGGESFSEPVRVTGEGRHEPARAPSLAVGGDGTVHLAWAVGEDAAADLRYSASRSEERSGGLAFAEPRVLFESGGHADVPKLAAGPDGALHLAWSESPAGVVGAHQIRYARSSGSGASFEAFREVAVPEGEYADFRFPSLALDKAGRPILLWELYPEGSDHPRGLALSAARGEGAAFSDPILVPGTADPAYRLNGSLQGRLMRKLAVNADGEIAVVNSGFAPLEASRILLVRGRLSR